MPGTARDCSPRARAVFGEAPDGLGFDLDDLDASHDGATGNGGICSGGLRRRRPTKLGLWNAPKLLLRQPKAPSARLDRMVTERAAWHIGYAPGCRAAQLRPTIDGVGLNLPPVWARSVLAYPETRRLSLGLTRALLTGEFSIPLSADALCIGGEEPRFMAEIQKMSCAVGPRTNSASLGKSYPPLRDGAPERASLVMTAILGMMRLDLATLRKAYDG